MSHPGADEYRSVQKTVWEAGAFDEVAKRFTWADGPIAVEAAAVGADDEVVDLACGSGNVAIRAAQAGARVTGLDIAPELLESARENAAAAGVELELVEGDASATPFADASFDVVTSVFGVQFAPRQDDVAAEIGRILRADGRIALINWTPTGFVGQMLKAMSAYMPPPPEFVQPPASWGDPEHVAGLFEGTGVEIETRIGHARFSHDSAEAMTDFMADHYGPTVMAKAALTEQGKWEQARADLIGLTAEFDGGDGALEVDGEYLITTGTKLS